MKKNTLIIVLTAICCTVLAGCSKRTNDPPKDYSSSFKNTVWTGEIRYSTRTKNEPFSVILKEDGKLEWYEFTGIYTGSYQVNNEKKEVTLTFSSGDSFTASIKNDSTLSNFRNNGSYSWEIRSAGLHNYAKGFSGQSVIGVTWSGNVPEISVQFKMTTLINQSLAYLEGGTSTPAPLYLTYSTGPATLSFAVGSIKYFGIIMSARKIVGVRTKSGTLDVLAWEANN